MDNTIAFKATNDPDTMHYHEVMRESDRVKSINSMVKEVEDPTNNNYWGLAPRRKVRR